MITLKIDEIKIESTNNNRRPVLRKKTLRAEYFKLFDGLKRNVCSIESAVETAMGMAIRQMTMVSDPKYKRSREELAWRFKEQFTRDEPMAGKLHVTIIIETYKDSDNFKIIMDALQDSGVLKNDRDVDYYTVVKTPVKRGSPEKIIVQIHSEAEQYKQQELKNDTPLRREDQVSG